MNKSSRLIAAAVLALASYGPAAAPQAFASVAQSFHLELRSGAYLVAQKQRSKFTEVMRGSMLSSRKDQILSFTVWRAADGNKLTFISGEFDSPLDAKREFDDSISKACKIIKRGKKRDSTGSVVGETAQIMALSSDTDKQIPTVLWTYGRNFYQIRSASMRDNLELAKLYAN